MDTSAPGNNGGNGSSPSPLKKTLQFPVVPEQHIEDVPSDTTQSNIQAIIHYLAQNNKLPLDTLLRQCLQAGYTKEEFSAALVHVDTTFASTPLPFSPGEKNPASTHYAPAPHIINPGQVPGVITNDASRATDQIRRLGDKVDSANVPAELVERLKERIARLALIRSSSGFTSSNYILEYENTATYINWVVGLPWEVETKDLLDLVKAKEALDRNHYGLEQIKQRILDYLATIILNLKNNQHENIIHAPILCLVGLAGTGKTTLAKSVAEALGKQFERIPFGGMADSRVLRGQSRAFPDAEPGAVIKRLVHAGSKNPVILLDELDRVTELARADIMGVLIELLDPEQNFAFTDHYIDYPFDLSRVLFIATANNTTNIATAVLDRLEVIQMPSYTDEEKIVIAHNYLFPKSWKQCGLMAGQLSINEDVWSHIIRPLGFDSGIRSLERTIDAMCRKAAREIVEGKTQQVVITNDNVKQYLPEW